MEVLMGKSSINGPFSMAMLNNQRVSIAVRKKIHGSGDKISHSTA
jgi:hypothetical protein